MVITQIRNTPNYHPTQIKSDPPKKKIKVFPYSIGKFYVRI